MISEQGKRPDLRFMQDILTVTYGDLITALERNSDFFHSREAIPTTIAYGQEIARNLIEAIPEILMVSADGFPYYVAHLKTPPYPVPEIGRFNGAQIQFYRDKILRGVSFRMNQNIPLTLEQLREALPSAGIADMYSQEKLAETQTTANITPSGAKTLMQYRKEHDIEVEDEPVPCPTCVAARNLANLRDPCKACDWTSIKPRDWLRILHDVDLQIVVDGDIETIAPKIREKLHEMGVPCNDEFLGYTILNTGTIFPVDTIIIQKEEYQKALYQLGSGANWLEVKTAGIKMWLRDEKVTWPYGLNFVFAMEPLACRDDQIIEEFLQTRKKLLEYHPSEKILTALAQLPRSYGRLMRSYPVQQGILDHLNATSAPFLVN